MWRIGIVLILACTGVHHSKAMRHLVSEISLLHGHRPLPPDHDHSGPPREELPYRFSGIAYPNVVRRVSRELTPGRGWVKHSHGGANGSEPCTFFYHARDGEEVVVSEEKKPGTVLVGLDIFPPGIL